jgi:hypothetical protein
MNMTALLIAIIAIICDVLGFVVPGFGLWFWIAGFVLSIIAFVMGRNAVKADPGNGKAKAGKILGLIFMIIGIVFIVLGILALTLFIGGLAFLGSALGS